MDLRQILEALRRSLAFVIAATLMGTIAGLVYVALTPIVYATSASVAVVGNAPDTLSDAVQAAQASQTVASTYAAIVDSPVVLTQVQERFSSSFTLNELQQAVQVSVRSETSILDISVRGSSASLVAEVADAVAQSAIVEIPRLQGMSAVSAPVQLKLLQNAAPPTDPAAPNVRGIALTTAFSGFIVGAVIALIRYALSTRPTRAR